jgi:hypothetical protein
MTGSYTQGAYPSQPFKLAGLFGFSWERGSIAQSGATAWGNPPALLDIVDQGIGANSQQLAGIVSMDTANGIGIGCVDDTLLLNWMEAQAQRDIYFVGVDFVKKGGRPGHEGLFRIQGQPVAETPQRFRHPSLPAQPQTTEFYLVTERGQTIQKLELHAVNSDREFLEFVGSVDLPNVPFRVAVIGRDSNDKQYQRFFSNLFHAESVEISAKLDFDELPEGSTKQVAFTVRNIGFPRTFKLTVTDAHQFVSHVEPKELALGAGESGTVRVDLAIPSGTAPGIGDDLVIVAQSSAGPPTSNSSVVHLSVSSSSATQNPRCIDVSRSSVLVLRGDSSPLIKEAGDAITLILGGSRATLQQSGYESR